MKANVKTVLVVDDEPKTCMQLSRLLTLTGKFNVVTALSGNEAIKLIETAHEDIDIIVTDMYMPEGTGLDVISKVRSEDLKIDLILISGGDRGQGIGDLEQDSFINSARVYGQAKFLKKPFGIQELVSKLDKCS